MNTQSAIDSTFSNSAVFLYGDIMDSDGVCDTVNREPSHVRVAEADWIDDESFTERLIELRNPEVSSRGLGAAYRGYRRQDFRYETNGALYKDMPAPANR